MRQRGFTLIEMLVVLAIVGLLASAARPMLELTHRRSQEFELRSALRNLRTAIDAYKRASDEGRVGRAADASGYPPDLQTLVQGVPDIRTPTGERIYFLRSLPRDPFADPTLPAAQTWALRSYDSPPDSPREGRDVFDLHSRSEQQALDGSNYREW